MPLFDEIRPQVYFDGGKLFKDKKTDKQMWRWKLVVDMCGDYAAALDEIVLNNYMAIETRENRVEEICIADDVMERQLIEFFGLADHTAPLLFVTSDIAGVSLSREDSLTQLHFEIEMVNTPLIHNFVRDHFFTRLWMTFKDEQHQLPGLHPARVKRENRKRLN